MAKKKYSYEQSFLSANNLPFLLSVKKFSLRVFFEKKEEKWTLVRYFLYLCNQIIEVLALTKTNNYDEN